jgi:hypothetical protein
MSMIQKQVELARELFELNASTVRRLFELQTEGVKQYFETNQEVARKLPEIKDVSSFVELQREYGETLWANTQENWQTRGDVLRTAVETAGVKMREAFTPETAKAA